MTASAPWAAASSEFGKAHIGLHGVDLADAAERLEMAGQFRPPDRHPHARPGLGDGPHHVAADEARAAIDRDQRPVVESDRHGLTL